MSLKIMNGFFEHRDVHKYTWVQPTRGLRSIIDYMIQRQNSKLRTTDVRAFRGPECGSDHYLLVAKVIVNYRKTQPKERPPEQSTSKLPNTIKYNLDSLRQDSVKFLYKLRLANKLQLIQTGNLNPEDIYQHTKRCIHEAASESLGCVENTKKQNSEWWSEELGELVENKKRAYKQWLNTQDNVDRQRYVQLNRKVKKMVIRSKNEMWEKKCEELDRCMGGTRVAQAWRTIKNLRKDGKQNNNLPLISNNEWTAYYKQLLTENREEFIAHDIAVDTAYNTTVREITVEEVKDTLKKTKSGKAAGPGNIPIELVKYGPDILLEILTKIFNKCMMEGHAIPEDWNVAYISSIFKKGDKKMCQNYRGISVTSAVGRLYGKILKNRIETEFSDIEEQSGFRAGRSCTDNIFVLQQLLEKRKDRNLDTHLLFVDLEKAYDTVPIQKLFEVMTKIGLNGVYIRSIWNLYRNAKSAVKCGNLISETFPVTKGLKQGCCLSPTLFRIYIQEALTQWRRQVSGMGIDISNDYLTTLFFADDQVVVAGDEDDMDFMFRKLLDSYKKWGLNINLKKTEYLVVGNVESDPELEINRNIKKCNEFKYLGSIFSREGTSRKDIHHRTQQGRNSIRILNSLLWSNQIKLSTKMTIYQSIVEPILTYGSECWQLSAKDRKGIETVEMDYLRRACRVSRLDRIPNEDIRRRTKRVFTSSDRIESRQLIWYGHVMRMTDERWPKRILNYVPQSKRRRGRPSTSWMQGIIQTMADRALNDEDWKNRKMWRSKCGMRQRL